jgi:hypothetical protein
VGVHVSHNKFRVACPVVLPSQLLENADEGSVLFLHLLMVRAALLGLPGAHEALHALEDLLHSAHMLVEEVTTVQLQEPVVSLVLLRLPMPPLLTRSQSLPVFLTFPLLAFALGARSNLFVIWSRRDYLCLKWVSMGGCEEVGENVVVGGFATACIERDGCEVWLQVEEETVRILVTLAHVMTHLSRNPYGRINTHTQN